MSRDADRSRQRADRFSQHLDERLERGVPRTKDTTTGLLFVVAAVAAILAIAYWQSARISVESERKIDRIGSGSSDAEANWAPAVGFAILSGGCLLIASIRRGADSEPRTKQPTSPEVARGSIVEELERLSAMRSDGDLTQEQFETAKRRLLDS